jgi:MFS family permease
MLSYDLKVLYIGRFFGGIATTLLFSVFEAWMITEYHSSCLEETKVSLSGIFANMTTISSVTAICCGVLGDSLVQYFGSQLAPFLASLGCCIGAGVLILAAWRENCGSIGTCKRSLEAQTLKHRMFIALTNPEVATLVFASSCFEGAMYLFVFFWSAALKSVRVKSGNHDDLPLGLVFSSFMCAMMAGSSISTTRNALLPNGIAKDMLLFIFAIASAAFAVSTLLNHEHSIFWAFCVIEGCIGAYFPKMALIKSNVVDDSVRGGVYSALRLPLNIFVVVVHGLDRDGRSLKLLIFAA